MTSQSFRTLGGVVAILMLVNLGSTAAECPPCGPDFCINDSRYPRLLAAKKAALTKQGYPTELINLLDKDGACVARIERAPDGFTILSVRQGENATVPWDRNEERIAREQLLKGLTIAYYKFNVRRAFACCNEPAAEKRADWDEDLSLSKALAIKCVKQGNAIQCR